MELVNITGYIHDIGPTSCGTLKEEVHRSDLLLVWGTVGED
jgi:hypothetical protein